jgi:hypothetical protein
VTTTLGNLICSANIRRSDRWLLGSILWFDPRREHSSVPTANPAAAARRACQGWPRLRGHPKGLALTGPSTVARSIGWGWWPPESATGTARTLIVPAPSTRQIQQPHTSATNAGGKRA